MNKLTIAAVMAEYQRAIAMIDRLVEVGFDAADISLVMSDREAERHFSPASRMASAMPVPFSDAVVKVAKALAPLAALGTRGTGVVAGGPLVSSLVTAGVGAGGGLRRGLTHLGLPQEKVEQVAQAVKNGGHIVAVEITNSDLQQQALEALGEVGGAFELRTGEHDSHAVKPTFRQPEPVATGTGSEDMETGEHIPIRRAG